MTNATKHLAILGAGNIGTSIANGLIQSEKFQPQQITLTRRRVHLLESFREHGFQITKDNGDAVQNSDIILLAVEPQQFDGLVNEIKPYLDAGRHIVISVVSGVKIKQILKQIGEHFPVVRAMPNTAIAIRESMTALAASNGDDSMIQAAQEIFDTVGKTIVINEEEMIGATALGACGIAFFLRAIRAASQGGIEIGFHSKDALLIAAQTAKGAASLLLNMEKHPEDEIDKVTTPRGCTIFGLNQMEHGGFSSAMIKGIIASAEKASKLYSGADESD
ncbi:pyrroline-5-carboxylate reductase [candidate division KSB1 bacterium]|nr:pyrroline-5-carboxylate reductase [candidate division KSB1 bacterium]